MALDPFERDLLLAPLLELRDLLAADLALAFVVFGFDDDFVRFGVAEARFGFDLAFVFV
ncbi:MAG TPA: hypothetical protein VFR75_05980 [Solirubrobacterales bacterium]|nr:hypothetical protein [Solirubrobacterales bacterium]